MNTKDWADQYRYELEKVASARAATLESLLFANDFEACRGWLNEWEAEDHQADSLPKRYRKILDQLKCDSEALLRRADRTQHISNSVLQ